MKATAGEPMRDFTIPSDIQFKKVNAATGLTTDGSTATAVTVALRTGQVNSGAEHTQTSTIIEEDLPPPKLK